MNEEIEQLREENETLRKQIAKVHDLYEEIERLKTAIKAWGRGMHGAHRSCTCPLCNNLCRIQVGYMMGDLVERLRQYQVSAPSEHPVHPDICDEAADRIEQLESWERLAKGHAQERIGLVEENRQLRREISTLKWWMNKDNLASAEAAMERGEYV